MITEKRQEIGKIIRKKRRELDVTQPQLAQEIDCNIASIVKIERGEKGYHFDILLRICDVLGLEIFINEVEV
jgi:DNA-binding XRE family transcriptional regulator